MKSDDVIGRVKAYEAIVKGNNIPEPGVPESFKVLIKELQSIALDIKVLSGDSKEIDIRDEEEEEIKAHRAKSELLPVPPAPDLPADSNSDSEPDSDSDPDSSDDVSDIDFVPDSLDSDIDFPFSQQEQDLSFDNFDNLYHDSIDDYKDYDE